MGQKNYLDNNEAQSEDTDQVIQLRVVGFPNDAYAGRLMMRTLLEVPLGDNCLVAMRSKDCWATSRFPTVCALVCR
jgi:hypothetical protein